MKRVKMLLTALGLAAFFTACAEAQDTENLFEMPESQPQDNTMVESETNPKTESKQKQESEVTLSHPYQYGNMQKNVPPGDFMSYGDEIVFMGDKFFLYTIDKETGEVSTFCKDAACQHNTAKCASSGVVSNLEQYNGKLYAQGSGGRILELKDGRFEEIIRGDIYNFWHANGKLYAVSRDNSLIEFENGSNTPRIIVDEYVDYWNVVFDNYLYSCSSSGIKRVDLSAQNPQPEVIVQNASSMIDGEHIYYMDDKTFILYRCNMDGSETEQLTEQPVLPASINFDEEYLYFRLFTNLEMDGEDSHDVYRLRKDNPEQMEKIAEFSYYAYTIYTVPDYDKIFVITFEKHEQGAKHEIYAVAKDGSSVELLEVPEY